MRAGTTVLVRAVRPEWARGLTGVVVAGGVRDRVAVDVGADSLLQVLPEDLAVVEPRPKELREAEIRAMASAFFVNDEVRKPKRLQKKHKLVKKAEELTEGQFDVLMELLEGTSLLCTVGTRSYTVRKTSVGWAVRGLAADDEEHTVADGACSCQDFKFRNRRCKHIEAVYKTGVEDAATHS